MTAPTPGCGSSLRSRRCVQEPSGPIPPQIAVDIHAGGSPLADLNAWYARVAAVRRNGTEPLESTLSRRSTSPSHARSGHSPAAHSINSSAGAQQQSWHGEAERLGRLEVENHARTERI